MDEKQNPDNPHSEDLRYKLICSYDALCPKFPFYSQFCEIISSRDVIFSPERLDSFTEFSKEGYFVSVLFDHLHRESKFYGTPFEEYVSANLNDDFVARHIGNLIKNFIIGQNKANLYSGKSFSENVLSLTLITVFKLKAAENVCAVLFGENSDCFNKIKPEIEKFLDCFLREASHSFYEAEEKMDKFCNLFGFEPLDYASLDLILLEKNREMFAKFFFCQFRTIFMEKDRTIDEEFFYKSFIPCFFEFLLKTSRLSIIELISWNNFRPSASYCSSDDKNDLNIRLVFFEFIKKFGSCTPGELKMCETGISNLTSRNRKPSRRKNADVVSLSVFKDKRRGRFRY
ncbi:hypothetical protein JXB01_00640 [Candidatus Micrarchaeota archaeon]|nr:hypothetical protein [Candidatus Micrarchaeota archaeon]